MGECPICISNIKKEDLCITNCSHKFCYDCLSHWLSINNNCPNCRESIETFNYKDMINRLYIVYNNDEDIENSNTNIEEVRTMLSNLDNHNERIKRLIICVKAISGFSLLIVITSIYLIIECDKF